MRIHSVKIKNFRSIVSCDFEFADLLVLVGKNNSGKSSIIDAIEMLLFKNKVNSVYDFNNTSKPVEIEVSFNNLTVFEKEKLNTYLDGDNFILKKNFFYKEKNNGESDSESKMFYIKDGKDNPTKAQNIFTGETLPEFYKVPAVKELKEETKIIGTTYFGKFLDLIFESDDYDFRNLDNLLGLIKKELERDDENAPLVKSAEEIEKIMCEQFKDCGLTFRIDTPKRKDLINKLEIFVNDDQDTPLSTKGHGTQRAFIFSILLLYAKKLNNKFGQIEGKNKKNIIIAIEEPEIYLHPHQQRIIYNLFKKLADNEGERIQIIYSTHSSFMVNIEDYKYLGFVSKNSSSEGAKITQYTKDIFEGDDKEEFKMVCQFDPERNEMFFADKIILCEGDTEKHSLPVIFDKLGLNLIDRRVSIIECGSKNNIPLFEKVLNKFNEKENRFNYYVFHDSDTPPKKFKNEAEKNRLEEEAKNLNQAILNLSSVDKIFVFNSDFESHLSLTIGDSDKPYKVKKQLSEKKEADLPVDLSEFIKRNFV